MGEEPYPFMLLEAMETPPNPGENASPAWDAVLAGISMGQHAQRLLAQLPKPYPDNSAKQLLLKEGRVPIP